MANKKIMLIANYWHFEEEKSSSRYRTMADVISKAGYDLEVITSSFRHLTKKQRNQDELNIKNLPYKMSLFFVPSYKKNISLKRIYSHHVLAKNITKYLNTVDLPDAIIVSVPSLSIGSAVTKFANKHNIPVIVDIQDLWPEAFKMAINIPIVSDILFAPMMYQANKIYKRADKITAVSETYVKRGLLVNKKDPIGKSIYIGTDPSLVAEATKDIVIQKPEGEFWVTYIGALGYSYDIKTIIDALEIIKDKGINNVVFKVMGDGPLKEEFVSYAKSKDINAEFFGFLEYGKMMANLSLSDVAVNPIVGASVSSIINKVSDYAISGTPVVNTQNSAEYRALLERYNAGINAQNQDPHSVAEAILKIYNDPDLRAEMKKGAKKMGDDWFDRSKTYGAIIDILKSQER